MTSPIPILRRGPRDIRRMMALQTAGEMLGEQKLLAEVLGIAPRQLRQKIAAERPIHDAEVLLAAAALVNRARQITEFSDRLTSLITEQGNS